MHRESSLDPFKAAARRMRPDSGRRPNDREFRFVAPVEQMMSRARSVPALVAGAGHDRHPGRSGGEVTHRLLRDRAACALHQGIDRDPQRPGVGLHDLHLREGQRAAEFGPHRMPQVVVVVLGGGSERVSLDPKRFTDGGRRFRRARYCA